MKIKIAILGSTGSIGKTLLNIVSKRKNDFEVYLLTANTNYKGLLNQTNKFKVKNVIISNYKSYLKFKKLNKNRNIKVFYNFKNYNKIFKNKIDYTMSSIVGLDGLSPTLNIIKYTRNIAIANKESIICGWNLIKNKLTKYRTEFIPVDSEHFSAWFSIKNKKNIISKIYLTASGGPFLNLPLKNFKKIKISDALSHPNWKMGKKISIDSATMMNKVFEVIEAKKIFELSFNKISILVHPTSYVHAILEYSNGLIEIVAHETSMKIPIYNSIFKSEKNLNFPHKKTQISKLNNLQLKNISATKYPSIKLLNLLPKNDSLFETILVTANDEFVNQFLNKKIEFNDISQNLIKFLNRTEFKKFKYLKPKNIKEIMNLSNYVRLKIRPKDI